MMALIFILLAAISLDHINHVQAQRSGYLSVNPGELKLVNGRTIFGNNVTLRNAYLPSSAKKSWVDFDNPLPMGILATFYFFTHYAAAPMEKIKIRLQIWSPTDPVNYAFTLKWEKQIVISNVSDPSGLLFMYTLSEEEKTTIQDNDLIGWTCESDFGAISFQYMEGHRSYFRKVDGEDYPIIGQTYSFDNIHLPAVFSVAVQIDQTNGTSTPSQGFSPNGTSIPPESGNEPPPCQGLSPNIYIGIDAGIGGLLFIAMIIGIVLCCKHKRQNKEVGTKRDGSQDAAHRPSLNISNPAFSPDVEPGSHTGDRNHLRRNQSNSSSQLSDGEGRYEEISSRPSGGGYQGLVRDSQARNYQGLVRDSHAAHRPGLNITNNQMNHNYPRDNQNNPRRNQSNSSSRTSDGEGRYEEISSQLSGRGYQGLVRDSQARNYQGLVRDSHADHRPGLNIPNPQRNHYNPRGNQNNPRRNQSNSSSQHSDGEGRYEEISSQTSGGGYQGLVQDSQARSYQDLHPGYDHLYEDVESNSPDYINVRDSTCDPSRRN